MTKYKCPNCGWIGTENEMDADHFIYTDENGIYDGEAWSNWICLSCNTWHQLEDYERIEE